MGLVRQPPLPVNAHLLTHKNALQKRFRPLLKHRYTETWGKTPLHRNVGEGMSGLVLLYDQCLRSRMQRSRGGAPPHLEVIAGTLWTKPAIFCAKLCLCLANDFSAQADWPHHSGSGSWLSYSGPAASPPWLLKPPGLTRTVHIGRGPSSPPTPSGPPSSWASCIFSLAVYGSNQGMPESATSLLLTTPSRYSDWVLALLPMALRPSLAMRGGSCPGTSAEHARGWVWHHALSDRSLCRRCMKPSGSWRACPYASGLWRSEMASSDA